MADRLSVVGRVGDSGPQTSVPQATAREAVNDWIRAKMEGSVHPQMVLDLLYFSTPPCSSGCRARIVLGVRLASLPTNDGRLPAAQASCDTVYVEPR